MTLATILLIIALILFIVDAILSRSLQSAGLAFVAAAMLAPLI
jgi:hypothetical protein